MRDNTEDVEGKEDGDTHIVSMYELAHKLKLNKATLELWNWIDFGHGNFKIKNTELFKEIYNDHIIENDSED